MIPVPLRNPPAGFMAKVAAPGRKWLRDHGIALNAKVPPGIRLPAYWTRCLDELNQTVYCTMRLRLIDRYLAHKRAGSAADCARALQELALASPFVHAEMVRQGWS